MDGSQPRKFTGLSRLLSSLKKRRFTEDSRKEKRRRRLGATIESLESRQLLTFAIDLFADINQIGVSSSIGESVEYGSQTIFVADDGKTGSELWTSDGTEAGTTLLKDILPGPDASSPSEFTLFGSELYFIALDENLETDLWKTDGTESGTVQVYDADAAGVYYLNQLTASGGNLFFTAYEQSTGYELWASDGTSAGTQLVLDINPDQSIIDRPQELTDVNGTLFFTSYENGYYNRELWKSDGTAVGTMMVKDLGIDPGLDPVDPADDDADFSSNPSYLTNVNGTLFFAAEDFEDGVELFKSDGTEAGTVMVSDLNPTGAAYPLDLTALNGDLVFTATADGVNRHLYSSDGATIQLLKDTTGGLGSSEPSELVVVGSELFFASNGSVPQATTSATTPTMTADNTLLVGGNYSGVVTATSSASAGTLGGFGGSIAFNSTTQGNPDEGPGTGWVASDARIGTAGVGLTSIEVGDLYIEDIDAGDLATDEWDWTISDPAGLTNISFTGFASGNEYNSADEFLTFELFLNGSAVAAESLQVSGNGLDNWLAGRNAGNVNLSNPGGMTITEATVRLTLSNNLASGGNEAVLVNAVLSADLDPATPKVDPVGRELHKTDGTPGGTVLVKDIVPMGVSSNPQELFEAGGKLYFSADDVSSGGRELWVSDGTEGGTVFVFDTAPGTDDYGAPLDGAPVLLGSTVAGDVLFTSSEDDGDRELWISDGTGPGTSLLKNINIATEDAEVADLITLGFGNPNLYFKANDGINGDAIWRADTTNGTATLFADVNGNSKFDSISRLTQFQNQIVFYNSAVGTQGGVYIVNEFGVINQLSTLRPVELDAEGTLFVTTGSEIFFVADDGTTGDELWSTNGVADATLVSDLVPGTTGSNPRELTNFAGALYLVADDPTDGRELLTAGGGTMSVIDNIRPGNADSDPEQLTVSGNRLYFTANDGSNGRELWSRQFSAASMVADIRPGGNGSLPGALTDVGGVLYFSANNGSDGFEPYRSGGTAGNTIQLADIDTTGSSNPSGFFPALGDVYFSANNGTDGQELYKVTTGLTPTVTQVANIQPGIGGSAPVPLFDTGKRLLFSAAGTGFEDRELWSTDGASNTLLVEDLYPSEFFGSDPEELTVIGNTIYFAAANDEFGRELFQLQESAVEVEDLVIGGIPGDALVSEVQRSQVDLIRVVFEGQVDVTLSSIELIHRESNTPVTTFVVNSVFEDGKTILELTFDPGTHVVNRNPGVAGSGNSLADGNYQLTILASGVVSPVSGVQMTQNYQFGTQATDRFFRQFGDNDGDRDVDGLDLGAFGQAFLSTSSSSNYNEDLDNDGDGDIDGLDLGAFGQVFLNTRPFI